MEELYRLKDIVEHEMKVALELMNSTTRDGGRNYYQGKANGMRYTLRFINNRIDGLKRQQQEISR